MSANKQRSCRERVREHYESRLEDLGKLWKRYQQGREDDDPDLGNIYEYGLCFDYVAKGTFPDQRQGYWRYQLSWGGPSDEFRFYADHALDLYRVEYWFLDWYDGAKVDCTKNKLVGELWEWFRECGSVQAEYDKARGAEA